MGLSIVLWWSKLYTTVFLEVQDVELNLSVIVDKLEFRENSKVFCEYLWSLIR